MLLLRKLQSWLGPSILILGVLIAVTLLEFAVSGESSAWTVRVYLALGALLIACYIIWVYVPGRRRVRRITELEEHCSRQSECIAHVFRQFQEGDLVAALDRVESLPNDVAQNVRDAAAAISGLAQQIQNVSVEVAGTGSTVQETATQLASGSSEQAASVVEITATMEELARTAEQIATNAAGQADLAAESEESGRLGAEAVEGAVAGVEQVRGHMDRIAERADTLDNRAREIYRVLDLIQEISHETHILSLNASIEASDAGEYGSRFTVIANEVRRLAERSRESVESVRNLLEEFSEAIRAVVLSTEEGAKATQSVLDRSRSSAEVIEELSTALANTARTAREISLATREQQTASNEVVVTVKEESDVIARIAAGLEHFTGASLRLNNLALSIQLLSQSFRIDSIHSLKHQALEIAARFSAIAGNLEAVEGQLREVFSDFPYLEMAYLVDPGGSLVAFAVNQKLVGADDQQVTINIGQVFTDRPWYQATGFEGRTTVTPVYESLLTGESCFTVAARVKDLDDQIVGTLGIDINVRNWTRI